MAVIQELEQIKELIPDPDYRPYGAIETVVPLETVRRKLLFAVTVNPVLNRPVGIFRARFVLLRRVDKYYMMITNFLKETEEFTDYMILNPGDGKPIIKEDWPFEKDDIGLFIRSAAYEKNIIYFIDNPKEMAKIREKLANRKLEKEVTVEVTIV